MGHSSHKQFSPTPAVRQALPQVAAVILLASLVGCAQPRWQAQLHSENPLDRIHGTILAAQSADNAALPLLIDRLEDDDVAVRMYAILALRKIEGTSLGYKYWADPIDRVHMTQRWRDYAKARAGRLATAGPQTTDRHTPPDNPAAHGSPPHPTPATHPFVQEVTAW